MKIKVLVDNNTYIDEYFLGEPAASYYIEDGESRFLFDTGYSDVLIRNAEKMEIDLNKINGIVLSHGHNDHTGGLRYLEKKIDLSTKDIIAHPDCFNQKFFEEEPIGTPFSTEEMSGLARLKLTEKPFKLSENLTFLGEIPRKNDFEIKRSLGKQREGNRWQEDFLLDDSAIVYHGEKGLFIVTGCSHSGICNIIEYAKNIFMEPKILGVLGGFHLFDTGECLEKTIEYLKKEDIKRLYPCHCVSMKVKIELAGCFEIREVGVGMELEV